MYIVQDISYYYFIYIFHNKSIILKCDIGLIVYLDNYDKINTGKNHFFITC